MSQSLASDKVKRVLDQVGAANAEFSKVYSGESFDRQPVHTVYGGAHLFKSDTAVRLAELAIRSFEAFAPDAATLATALGIVDRKIAELVRRRVGEKLRREAVEDFRIDFEDGFGSRPDPEEDAVAIQAAIEVAKGMKDKTLPPFIGIRVKTLSEEHKHRAIRTLDLFVSTLCQSGGLPPGFVVTLPKVTIPEQVTAFVEVLTMLEDALKLKPGSLKMEIMIEVTQAVIDRQGYSNLPGLAVAGGSRITAAHFGVYDYTASCQVTAAHQAMDHPACDFARSMMKVAYGGMPIFLSDGATNVMPVPPHKGDALTEAQRRENAAVVHRAWKLAYDHTRHSLRNAFYQGWDLHPAQLPVRYAACYAFFLESLDEATDRLRTFIDKAAQATLLGDIFDDAATGQGLLNYFLRALNCGAINLDEIKATGLSVPEIQSRSFAKIMKDRRAKLAGGR